MNNQNIFNFIANGKKGDNLGFNFSIEKLNKFIKIWQSKYYLIFAYSGVGKSKLTYHQFIFNVIDHQIKYNTVDELHIDLYSLEISPVTVKGIMILFYLQKYKGIVSDLGQLFSFEKPISDELNKLVNSDEIKNYVDKIDKYLTIYTHLNLNNLVKNTENYLSKNGQIIKNNNLIQDYIPNSKRRLYEIIIDHISLSENIQSKTKYESIGIYSRYLFSMRNITGLTPVIIQQANPDKTRDLKDTLLPSHEDLRDSKETFNDADIALTIGSPLKHKLLSYEGYKIFPSLDWTGLQDRFRIIEIKKNRYGGGSNFVIPTLFLGETSQYFDIKKSSELTKEDYLKINNLKKTYE